MAGVLGSAPGVIVGAGVGLAASSALEPAFEIPRQTAWEANPNKVLDAGLMARLVAQGGVSLGEGEASALREGFNQDKFDHLVYLAQTVPGVGEATALWRLGLLDDDLFTHVLVKAGLDQRYVKPIQDRKLAEVVGLGDIGYSVVRGILPTPSWVPVAPPTQGDKVPRFPQVDIDPLELAHKLGYDEDMLRLIVGRSGLSMAPTMAANAEFRGIIGPNDFLLAIAEGDLRTEWAEAVHEASREILTAGQYTELQIRGFSSAAQRRADTAKHGMSVEDSDKLYNVLGRAPSVHAITTGLARGGKYPGNYANVPEPYKSSLQRSSIREEFSEIEYANRYSYPSAFVLRSLAQAGELGDTAAVEAILLDIGWPPQLAAKVAGEWVPVGAKADPWLTKARNHAWTHLQTDYGKGTVTVDQANVVMDAIGVAQAVRPDIFAVWDAAKAV